MACEAERRPLGVFECQLCSLTAPYSYVGQKPPNTQSIILLEESFVTKDPFTPDKDRFLILGSRCSICGRLVCVGPDGDISHCSWGAFQRKQPHFPELVGHQGLRNAACSTPRGSASLASRRTSTPSLRKFGRTWGKGKFRRRGRPASPALRPERSLDRLGQCGLSWEPATCRP
ncbi:cysteine-rich DPF motif domain-containing protein 1 isoform 1-T3 [Glossophaga mutica]